MITVNVDGISEEVPEDNEPEFTWGEPLSTYLVDIATFLNNRVKITTAQDIAGIKNFTDGITTALIKSGTTNPAAASFFRMAKTDVIAWRNNANNADLALAIDGSNRLTFNGTIVPLIANYEYQTLSGTFTMTSANSSFQYINPNGANRIVILPTTNILLGQPINIVNIDPTYSLTLQASDASQVYGTFIDSTIEVIAKQATPVSNAHWKIVDAYSNYPVVQYEAGQILSGSNRLAFSIEYSASVGTYRTTGGYAKVTPYRTVDGKWRTKVNGYAEFGATNDVVYFKLWGDHTQNTAWVANGETVSVVGMTGKSGIVQFGESSFCDQNNFASGSIGTRDYAKIASASTYFEGNSTVNNYVSTFFNMDFELNLKPTWLTY